MTEPGATPADATDQPVDQPVDQPGGRAVPSDQPPSVDAGADGPPPADESARQAQDTVRSISRLEESN